MNFDEMTPSQQAAHFSSLSDRRSAYRDRVDRGRDDPTLIPHGSLGGYSNWGCRCAECRTAERAYSARVRDRQTKAAFTPAEEHGLDGYRYGGCRCNVCTVAMHQDLVRMGFEILLLRESCPCAQCVAHFSSELL